MSESDNERTEVRESENESSESNNEPSPDWDDHRCGVAPLSGSQLYQKATETILAQRDLATTRDTNTLHRCEDGLWRDNGERFVEEDVEALLRADATNHTVSQVVGKVKRQSRCNRAELQPDARTLPVANGVLDLETGDLEPYGDDGVLWRLPVAYDPGADAPEFQAFLDDVVTPQGATTLQEMVGYALLHWDVPYDRALLLLGDGRNGKSTFLHVVERLLGDNNCSNLSLHQLASERFAPAELHGKLVNINADLDGSDLDDTGQFKQLVSGDSMKAERKHKDPFTFRNTAKLLFSANQTPPVTDDSPAFYRRWLLVEFPNEFGANDADPYLARKLTTNEELSGVLNWALEGLARIRDQDGFTHEQPPNVTRKRWHGLSADPIDRFVHEELVTGTDGWLSKDEVVDACEAYCSRVGASPPSKTEVTRTLREHFDVDTAKPRTDEGRVPAYEGVRWADEPDLGITWEETVAESEATA